MLYDTQRTSNFSPEFFEPEYWRKHDAIEGTARGRGTTWFIRAGDSQLRTASLPPRRPDGKNLHGRVLVEWRIGDAFLRRVVPHLSPASRGLACAHTHRGVLPAPGAFLSRRPHHPAHREQRTAGGAAVEGPLSFTQWIAVGRCIRRFHDAGVYHADLNAHNILLTPEQVYLIDFDRGELRKRGWWADTTLVRLYRSLEKVTLLAAPESFTDEDWHSLLAGYRESAGLPQAIASLKRRLALRLHLHRLSICAVVARRARAARLSRPQPLAGIFAALRLRAGSARPAQHLGARGVGGRSAGVGAAGRSAAEAFPGTSRWC